ncbi:DUF2589 domain-containing protein [Reichenbachiella sp.]|uniref:DUF2589 domain-containing protein n=1 Tax=Reichenbachiella sp. TaxID=2184521 RepID=UPI003BB0D695
MAEKALVSMAQQFQGLPMDSLIGGPLNAAAKANAAMALTQTTFMLDTCFTKTDSGIKSPSGDTVYNYSPIMIKMSLTRGVITPKDPTDPKSKTDIQEMETKFDLPIITIIPLNSLAVDNVDITFDMEVKSSYGEEASQETTQKIAAAASFEAKVGYGPFSATVKGSASYDKEDKASSSSHYEKSNSAKYHVAVHAAQLPMPKGVNTIIDAFSKAIEPVTMPTVKNSGGKGGNTP